MFFVLLLQQFLDPLLMPVRYSALSQFSQGESDVHGHFALESELLWRDMLEQNPFTVANLKPPCCPVRQIHHIHLYLRGQSQHIQGVSAGRNNPGLVPLDYRLGNLIQSGENDTQADNSLNLRETEDSTCYPEYRPRLDHPI